MKLSEKIKYLRKKQGYTQEQLAEKCNVSRQAITKWEADISIPETEKFILLSRLFNVSIDELLKDELDVFEKDNNFSCGKTPFNDNESLIYEGILVKESITDENIIDLMEVKKVELWNTGGMPKYWTVIFFSSVYSDFPERISKVMKTGDTIDEKWFVDFKSKNIKYIVFKDVILKYRIGNIEEKRKVCEYCSKLGIPKEQMNWPEE